MPRRRVVFLIAPPASGKGTQAKFLEEVGFSRIEMSKVLRERNVFCEETAGKGERMDCDIVIDALSGHLAEAPLGHDLAFDGFPRTLEQAKFAVEQFVKPGGFQVLFLIIEVSDDTTLERLRERQKNGDDRKDSNTEAHKKRLRDYREKIVELAMYLCFHAPGSVRLIVDDNRKPKVIAGEIRELVDTVCV